MLSIFLEIETLLFIFILTWTFDTFAYLFGKKFGKHKIILLYHQKNHGKGLLEV